MKTLEDSTALLIKTELNNLPERYRLKNFNSTHEAYAVILEEVRELEHEVFFGEKECRKQFENDLDKAWAKSHASDLHRKRMQEECVQIAAMCVRMIQELTTKFEAE